MHKGSILVVQGKFLFGIRCDVNWVAWRVRLARVRTVGRKGEREGG